MIEQYIKTKLKIRGIKAHSGILQNSVMNLEFTLKEFFKNRDEKGFPKFKKSSLWQQSFEFKNQITSKYFKIMKMEISPKITFQTKKNYRKKRI